MHSTNRRRKMREKMKMKREKEKETKILEFIISRIHRNFVSVKATFEKMLNAKPLEQQSEICMV